MIWLLVIPATLGVLLSVLVTERFKIDA